MAYRVVSFFVTLRIVVLYKYQRNDQKYKNILTVLYLTNAMFQANLSCLVSVRDFNVSST